MRNSGKIAIILTVIFLLTAAAYSNIFSNGFVIDDQYFISDWELTRSWSNVGQLLKGANPPTQPGVYRPVRGLLYLVYYQFFGANPFFYHLHSLTVHLISTILVYLIMRELWFVVISREPPVGGSRGNPDASRQIAASSRYRVGTPRNDNFAFIGALLFGLHPIHTESITYIAASMEMTGVMFMLGSFYLYITIFNFKFLIFKQLQITHILSLFLLALLAFFTYEMTLTLPLLILWYEWTLPVGIRTLRVRLPRRPPAGGLLAMTIAAGAGVYGLVRFGLGVGLARGDYLAFSPYHTFLTMTKMVVKYIQLLIWPVTLSHNHTVVPGFEAFMTPYSDQKAILAQSIFDPEILASITVITVIMVITVIKRKQFPLLSFGLGWFFISLFPVLYIFPQGTAISEKYLYLGSVGGLTVIAYLIFNLKFLIFNQFQISNFKFQIVLISLLAIFYGGRTFARNQNWESPITLWEYESKIHPKSELAFYNLGIYYSRFGETQKAVAAYKKALELKPEFWQAENNLQRLKQ